MTVTDVELKAVRVSMAPPRRLMASNRFRSLKTRDDRTLWRDLVEPVLALMDEGWSVVAVEVAWGTRIPLALAAREKAARDLTGCAHWLCTYTEVAGAPGRGQTTFTLERER